MLNILHLINFAGGGGTENYIYSLAKKMHNKNCKLFIGYSEEGPSLELFQSLGIETIKLSMNSPYDLKAAKSLQKICREKSIDIIHTHFLRENYISILSKIFGNKSIIINTRHMLLKNSKAVIYANKLMTSFNKKIIAVSKAVEDSLINESINHDKIQLIYTGVDTDDWKITKDLSFRNEFNINNEDILIASVARFSEEKGHSFLLESISDFKELLLNKGLSDLKFKFVLVGDGELLESSKALANDLGISKDIIFTGYRNDIRNILNSCNLFVSHSESEAFGISILEALASGLPVITTDSGGTREIINEDSQCGILIDFGNRDEFAHALLKLVSDKNLANSYKNNGLILLDKKFSLDKTAEETYNLYSSNLHRK